MSLFELTIMDGVELIYEGTFSPSFPHTKNIYEALTVANRQAVQGLVGHIQDNGWEQTQKLLWKQSIVVGKKKLILYMREKPERFFPTVPMMTYAYEESK